MHMVRLIRVKPRPSIKPINPSVNETISHARSNNAPRPGLKAFRT